MKHILLETAQKEKAKNPVIIYYIFQIQTAIFLPYVKHCFFVFFVVCLFFFLKGFLIYFTYGIRHSLEGNLRDEGDDEDSYSDNINTAMEEKSAIQASDHHQRNLSLPFIFHEKTSEC